MQNVKVDKTQLLNVLTDNLSKHESELVTLFAQYKAETISQLQQTIESFKNDVLNIPSFLPKPKSHTNDYNRAIKMVMMSVDTTIELDEKTFSELVMDEWGWKHEFEMTKSLYGNF